MIVTFANVVFSLPEVWRYECCYRALAGPENGCSAKAMKMYLLPLIWLGQELGLSARHLNPLDKKSH